MAELSFKQSDVEEVVDRQLVAYNSSDYETFASCYHEDIISYDLETCASNPQMCGEKFFAHYKDKFTNNPHIHCEVTMRFVHGNLIVDKEIIRGYQNKTHTELVIYQVDGGRISKMWFANEIAQEPLLEK